MNSSVAQAGYDENIELDKKNGVKDPSWKGAQKMMANPEKFLQNLKGFKNFIDDGKVPQQNVEKARKIQRLGTRLKPHEDENSLED